MRCNCIADPWRQPTLQVGIGLGLLTVTVGGIALFAIKGMHLPGEFQKIGRVGIPGSIALLSGGMLVTAICLRALILGRSESTQSENKPTGRDVHPINLDTTGLSEGTQTSPQHSKVIASYRPDGHESSPLDLPHSPISSLTEDPDLAIFETMRKADFSQIIKGGKSYFLCNTSFPETDELFGRKNMRFFIDGCLFKCDWGGKLESYVFSPVYTALENQPEMLAKNRLVIALSFEKRIDSYIEGYLLLLALIVCRRDKMETIVLVPEPLYGEMSKIVDWCFKLSSTVSIRWYTPGSQYDLGVLISDRYCKDCISVHKVEGKYKRVPRPEDLQLD